MNLACPACGARAATGPVYPSRCACGGLWRSADPPLDAAAIRGDSAARPWIPLWPDPIDANLRWKREDLNPTGSFKDRGAETLAAVAGRVGASALVLDSSGGAALAAARVASLAGLPLTLHVPAGLSRTRLDLLASFDCRVVARGDRAAAAARAADEAGERFWFSHVFHPAFLEGTALSGIEVLDEEGAGPGTWIVPTGNGSLLLGLHLALTRRARRDVRLVAVQAAACPGLVEPGRCAATCATGIAIVDPPRRAEVLAALIETGGEVIAVDEDAIDDAWHALARRGVIAEPASAAALAAVVQLRARGERGRCTAWLTGSGSRG